MNTDKCHGCKKADEGLKNANINWVCCTECQLWYLNHCIRMSSLEHKELISNKDYQWYCSDCVISKKNGAISINIKNQIKAAFAESLKDFSADIDKWKSLVEENHSELSEKIKHLEEKSSSLKNIYSKLAVAPIVCSFSSVAERHTFLKFYFDNIKSFYVKVLGGESAGSYSGLRIFISNNLTLKNLKILHATNRLRKVKPNLKCNVKNGLVHFNKIPLYFFDQLDGLIGVEY